MSNRTFSLRGRIGLDSREFVKGAKKAENAVEDVGEEMEELPSKAKAEGGKAGGLLGDSLAKGFAAVGVGAILAESLNQNLDIEQGTSRVKAQFALTADEAERFGKLGGELYADGWGESVPEVTGVLAEIERSLGDLTDLSGEELGAIGEQVIALADTFDQDANAVIRSTGQLLRNGLAPDAKSALDIVTVAFQEGGDRAGDLLDTIDEYSQHWHTLGVEGDEALGLIVEGFRQGFRDGDKLADLLKEFSIRSLTDQAARAFEELGLNAETMQTQFAEGGESAREALGLVIDRLDETEDPIERNRLAVELFGTQFEDLGPQAIGVLQTIDAGLGDVEGAAADVAETVGDNAATSFETLKREGMEALNQLTAVALPLISLFDHIADGDIEGAAADTRSLGEELGALPLVDFTQDMWDRGPGALLGFLDGVEEEAPEAAGALEDLTGVISDGTHAMRRELEAGEELASTMVDLEALSLGLTNTKDAQTVAHELAAEAEAAQAEATRQLEADLRRAADASTRMESATMGLASASNSAEEAGWRLDDSVAAFAETLASGATPGTREYESALNDAEEDALRYAQAQADAQVATRLANGEVVTATDEQNIYREALNDVAAKLDGPVREAVNAHIGRINNIPANKVTAIMAELDVSRAEATYLEWSSRPRELQISTYVGVRGPGVRYLASGGPVSAGEVAVVGEEGPELVYFSRNAQVIPAGPTAAMMGRGGPVGPPAPSGSGGGVVTGNGALVEQTWNVQSATPAEVARGIESALFAHSS